MAVRACSHEHRTVNYPGVMMPWAKVTSRYHDDLLLQCKVAPDQLHCPGASLFLSDHYKLPLVFAQIVTGIQF